MEGGLTVDPGWFQLWPEGQLDELNAAYEVHHFAPSHYGFGSNGGGELLAFNQEGRIVMIPFVGDGEADAWLVADSWREFEAAMEPPESGQSASTS